MSATAKIARATDAVTVHPAMIGGAPVMTADSIEVFDPATGKVFARVARGGAGEIDQAVRAARKAYEGGWRLTSPLERSRLLTRMAEAITARGEELAAIESRDTGKPIRQARIDVGFIARYFEYYAHLVEAMFGRVIPGQTDRLTYSTREPYGVSAHIIPWNYPLGMAGRTVAPALAAGNCCVLKPAEQAPLSCLLLAEIANEAGLPPGTLNVVPGLGAEAGAALSAHPGIDIVSFTGSVPVGRMVALAAAQNLIPAILELGGKSPNIVMADADLDAALPVLTSSILQNCGQTCSAGSRLLVHESLHGELVERLAERFAATSIGPGHADPGIGPLISATQHGRVLGLIEAGRSEARLVAGGGRPEGDAYGEGYFVAPTLFDDVPAEARIAREEIFGPVLAVTPFSTDAEAIALANGTDYGLVAGLWTRDLGRAHRFIRDLDCGQVMVNTFSNGVELPFGGRKKSGYGVEKGFEALEGFTRVKGAVVMMADA
jgi:aldehyde dehydrogenase (NAD+)